jgi:hypothetical protein
VIKLQKQIERPTFEEVNISVMCRYITIEDLLEKWESILENGQDMSAIDEIARSFDLQTAIALRKRKYHVE